MGPERVHPRQVTAAGAPAYFAAVIMPHPTSPVRIALALALATPSLIVCGDSESDDTGAPTTGAEAGETADTEDDSPQSTAPGDASAASTDGDDSGSSSDTSEDPSTTDTATTDDGADTSSDTGAPVDQLPPLPGDALLPWLQDNRYAGWAAESGVHPSAGPHGGGVRTFVNDALFDSLAAGDATHPEGAAVVKELYDGGTLDGWAVMLKVTPGTGGASWYWYEIIGASVVADDTDVGLCVGCHSSATDHVRTPFPLQ